MSKTGITFSLGVLAGILLSFAAVLCIRAIILPAFTNSPFENPLPEPSSVRSNVYNNYVLDEHGALSVHGYEELYNLLARSRYDPFPAKWVVLGSVDVMRKDGGRTVISLFYVDEPLRREGAFSVDRKYFRGGTTAGILKVLCMEDERTKNAEPSAVEDAQKSPRASEP